MFIRGSLIPYQLILKLAFGVLIYCLNSFISILIFLMLIDIIISIFRAITEKFTKSVSGRFKKEQMTLVIIKKLTTMLLICTAALIDSMLGTAHIKEAISCLFCASEVKSIIINAEAIGVQCASFFKSIVITLEDLSGKHTDTYFKDDKK